MALSLLTFQENSCRWMLIKYSCELTFGFCILVGFLRALHPSIAADIDFEYVTVWHYRRWLRVAIELRPVWHLLNTDKRPNLSLPKGFGVAIN